MNILNRVFSSLSFMFVGILLFTFLFIFPQHVGAAERPVRPVLPVAVYDYPPSIVNAATAPSGLFIEKIKAITELADFTIEWLPISMAEEGRMLDNGLRPFCTTGRIYTEERGKMWAFLPHVFADLAPDVIIAHRESSAAVAQYEDSLSLLKSSSLRGVFVRGGIYGDVLDQIIQQGQHQLSDIGQSDSHTLTLVATNRADYTIVPNDIWEARKDNPEFTGKLQAVALKHAFPVSEPIPIFLVCSRAMPTVTLQKLQSAMQALGYKLPITPITSFAVSGGTSIKR